MNIQSLPENIILQFFIYTNGVDICEKQTISKKIKSIIDSNENYLYFLRMNIEYPKEFRLYKASFPIREDWKNLYVISDQYSIAKKKAPKYRKIIEYRETASVLDTVASIVESVLSCLTIFLNISKVTIFGFSASRIMIKEFIRNNPGSSFADAMKSLGMSVPKILLDKNIDYDINFY